MPDESKPQSEKLRTRVKRLLSERKLTQAEVARKSGIDRSTLNRFLKGERDLTGMQIMWLAQVLGVAADDLVAGAELTDAARDALQEFAAATQRAVKAESERDQLMLEVEKARADLDAARAAHVADLEGRDRLLEEERARATIERDRAVREEREHGERTLALAKAEKASIEQELKQLRFQGIGERMSLAMAKSEVKQLKEYAAGLEAQIQAKTGNTVGIATLAALGGLFLGSGGGGAPGGGRRRR